MLFTPCYGCLDASSLVSTSEFCGDALRMQVNGNLVASSEIWAEGVFVEAHDGSLPGAIVNR